MRLPRAVWLVALLSASGSCVCGGGGGGCAPTFEPIGCGGFAIDGCPDGGIAHGTVTPGYWGGCIATCDHGWKSCSAGSNDCNCVDPDAVPPKEWSYRFTDLPHGLAVCGPSIYVVDGTELVHLRTDVSKNPVDVVDSVPLPSDATGGMACDESGGVVFGVDALDGGALLNYTDAGLTEWIPGVHPRRGLVFVGSELAFRGLGPSSEAGTGLMLLDDGGIAELGSLDETAIDYPFATNGHELRWLEDGAVRSQILVPYPEAGTDASDGGDAASGADLDAGSFDAADGDDADAGTDAAADPGDPGTLVGLAADDASFVALARHDSDAGATFTFVPPSGDAGLTRVRAISRRGGSTYVALADRLLRIAPDGSRSVRATWLRFVEMFVTDDFVYWTEIASINGVDRGMLYRIPR